MSAAPHDVASMPSSNNLSVGCLHDRRAPRSLPMLTVRPSCVPFLVDFIFTILLANQPIHKPESARQKGGTLARDAILNRNHKLARPIGRQPLRGNMGNIVIADRALSAESAAGCEPQQVFDAVIHPAARRSHRTIRALSCAGRASDQSDRG